MRLSLGIDCKISSIFRINDARNSLVTSRSKPYLYGLTSVSKVSDNSGVIKEPKKTKNAP